ncbi:MAG: hypothetical protein U0793_06430 [Gemmataceae bacterium]
MRQLTPIVRKLQPIRWTWTRASMEEIAAALGLSDRTTGSDTWVGYRSPDPEFPAPDPEFPGELMEHPYGFNFRGQEMSQFQLCLGAADMGEVYLHESGRYNEVCKQRHAEFKANFDKAVKEITTVLGKPVFRGRPRDPGSVAAYPLGWGGELTAVWPLTNARLILVFGQEDKELPIVLDLFVCPPRNDAE